MSSVETRSLEGLVPVSLLVLACGGASTRTEGRPDEPPSSVQGGERLRSIFLESVDGIGAFRNFHDTELDLVCSFLEAESGTWRCLPSGLGATFVSEIVYTDAACAAPHAPLYSPRDTAEACSPPRYAVLAPGCGQAPEVFVLGNASRSDARYRLVDGACVLSSSGTDYLTTPFAATPLPLEDFQSGRLTLGDPTGGIVPVDLLSDDGAAVRLGFRDALEGFDCALSDEENRCVPTDVGYISGLFADARCSEPAAIALGCSEQRSELAFARSRGDTVSYHRGGGRLSATYTGSPESCMEADGPRGFAVGTEVPLSRFAAGLREPVMGAALDTVRDSVGAAELPARVLRSRAYQGFDCYPAHGASGELRCMPPPEMFPRGLFADAGCTQPVDHTDTPYLSLEIEGVCPAQVRVYEKGDRYSGAVYAVTDGICAYAFDRPPDDSPRIPHFVYPTEIPDSAFALLFRVVR